MVVVDDPRTPRVTAFPRRTGLRIIGVARTPAGRYGGGVKPGRSGCGVSEHMGGGEVDEWGEGRPLWWSPLSGG